MVDMRRIVVLTVSLALAVLFVSGAWDSATREARGATARPNIVFIVADDMRYDDLKYMPKTRSVLKAKGLSFSNAFVSNSLCCPSWATIRGASTRTIPGCGPIRTAPGEVGRRTRTRVTRT